MEFCGRCGHELGRGLERGRFCPKCGHETPGNARYPLYADGTPAVTRPRPASVSQSADATVVAAPRVAATAVRPAVTDQTATPAPPQQATPAPPAPAAEGPADVTRRRPRSIFDAVSEATPSTATSTDADESGAGWQVALVATLVAMLVVVVLGFFLLMR